MPQIAVLDAQLRLIGFTTKEVALKSDVVVPDECDLPVDGTYKWVEGHNAFLPLGHGFQRTRRPPIADTRVIYELAKLMLDKLPEECKAWVQWYEENMKRRHEEEAVSQDTASRKRVARRSQVPNVKRQGK